jgi:6-phosphofructokinase 1
VTVARLKGVAVIGQSGGPTCVINRSLVAAVEELKKSKEVTGIYGAVAGVEGILAEQFVDLRKQSAATLRKLCDTPSAGLASSRKKPKPEDCRRAFEVFRKHNVRYFFYIGGGDSAQTANDINTFAKNEGYEFRTFHVPKTIDNDLPISDHTPGYGTAARFVASAFMGDDLDNRSLRGIKINVVMGRHAGYLACASVLGKADPDSGPHLVYCPERPFIMDKFIADVEAVHSRLGRCIVAVSEGTASGPKEEDLIVFEAGRVMLKPEVQAELPRDERGHPQLSGSGILADYLVYRLRHALETKYGKKFRLRGDTFGYLQRCFPGVISELDAKEASLVGRAAVKFALTRDIDGSVILEKRRPGEKYRTRINCVPLTDVAARGEIEMPDDYINEAGNYPTRKFIDYAMPLVGKLPQIALLKRKMIATGKK